MDETISSWSDWVQGVSSTLVNAKIASWQANQTPVSVSPYGQPYPDGKPATMTVAGMSPGVLIAGAAVLLLAVFMLKD